MNKYNLYCGDCFDVMDLSDFPHDVDMVLCDLPYGTTQNEWDKPIEFTRMWEYVHRVAKENAAVVFFSGQPFTSALINSNLKEFKYEIIWRKNRVTGFLNAHRMPLRVHENILVFYKKQPVFNPQFTEGKPYKGVQRKDRSGHNYGSIKADRYVENDGRRFPVDVIDFDIDQPVKGRLYHPTQKPVALLEWLVKTYTNEGGTVLDFTMGSGTTGVACMNTGRGFAGIELSREYYDLACERIEEANEARIAKEVENDSKD